MPLSVSPPRRLLPGTYFSFQLMTLPNILPPVARILMDRGSSRGSAGYVSWTEEEVQSDEQVPHKVPEGRGDNNKHNKINVLALGRFY